MKYLSSSILVAGISMASGAMASNSTDTNASSTLSNINGYNVSVVYYDGGEYRQTGPSNWTDFGVDYRADYIETGRDEWSVYLSNNSNKNIQLDLWTRTITIREIDYPEYVERIISVN